MAGRPVIVVIDGSKFERGGVQQHVLDLVSRYDPDRFDVVLVRRARNFATDLLAAKGNVRIVLIPLSRAVDPVAIVRLASLFGRERPSILHTHGPAAGFSGRIASWLHVGIRTVHTVHGPALLDMLRLEGAAAQGRVKVAMKVWLERVLDRCTDRLIVLSEADAQTLIAEGNATKESIRIVPNGIDFDALDVAAGNEPGASGHGNLRILSVGNLTEQKGHIYLLDAMAELRRRGVSVNLKIVGEGPLRDQLLARRDRLQLDDVVEFMGRRTDVPFLLRRADAFVLPSLWEGMPISLLEAMALSRPCIVSAVNGIPSMVNDGVDALSVRPMDSTALAAAIARLATDAALRRKLGAGAGERVRALYGVDRMVRETIRCYEELLDESPDGVARN